MRKEEIMKITNKELVKQLGAEQLEWFRKKIYKYRRRDLLFFDVEFHLLSELENVNGIQHQKIINLFFCIFS